MEEGKEEANIMQMIDKGKMEVIERAFTEEGLNIYEFIKVMHEHLNFKKEDPEELVRTTVSLVDLFREIDVNGDQTMEWDEFNNHVIELGMLRNDRSFKNVIKNYYPSEHIRDREKHENGI
jgi:WD40 repeat protein